MKRFHLVILPLLSLALGLVAAGLIMDISWQHNPQCEIHCDGQVHWLYWLVLGSSWLVPVFMVSYLFGALGSAVIRLACRIF